jgi:hypothetical protein
MPAQFRLVMNPAETESFEGPPHGPGDRLAQTRLAHAGRPDEAEDRGLGRRIQFQHGQMFDDAFLYFLDAVVVLFEHLANFGKIQMFLGRFFPGKFEDQFQIGSEYLMVRR